jgi:F0F1-type ATP synthase membrane subunit a
MMNEAVSAALFLRSIFWIAFEVLAGIIIAYILILLTISLHVRWPKGG